MHIDNQTSNVESIVLGLSHFEGGQLWLQDGCGKVYDEIRGQLQRAGSMKSVAGAMPYIDIPHYDGTGHCLGARVTGWSLLPIL